MRIARVIMLGLALLALAGCFDVETEIKLLHDGSGFVAVWVRLPTRTASIAAALQGSTLAEEKQQILARLDDLFQDQPGVRLIERQIQVEGEYQILRYRYAFDRAADVNRFWADPENAKQDITIAGAKLDFKAAGGDCDATYDAAIGFPPSPPQTLDKIGHPLIDRQPTEVRAQFIEEYYQGRFRLRLVLPGQTIGTDAEFVDTAGFPIWQTSLLDLHRQGLTAKTSSRQTCDETGGRRPAPGEAVPLPFTSLTEGPKATIGDVFLALNSLGDVVTMSIDAEVDKTSRLEITYRIDSRIDQPLENLLQLVWNTLPTLARDWDWIKARDAQGALLLTIRTKKALRLDETGSSALFAGRDGDQFTFRLKLPPLVAATTLPPEAVGSVIVRVKVKMPKPIAHSNATWIEGASARWLLTARDLTQPLVIEAICPR
jgi:hypothetical protein